MSFSGRRRADALWRALLIGRAPDAGPPVGPDRPEGGAPAAAPDATPAGGPTAAHGAAPAEVARLRSDLRAELARLAGEGPRPGEPPG